MTKRSINDMIDLMVDIHVEYELYMSCSMSYLLLDLRIVTCFKLNRHMMITTTQRLNMTL